jgi:hypothetical protein
MPNKIPAVVAMLAKTTIGDSVGIKTSLGISLIVSVIVGFGIVGGRGGGVYGILTAVGTIGSRKLCVGGGGGGRDGV